MSEKKIKIEDVKLAVNILLDHIRDGGITEIKVSNDYYWNIDREEVYDIANSPKELTIGSLVDDADSIKKFVENKDEPVVLLLLKVAPIINHIADTVTESQLSSRKIG